MPAVLDGVARAFSAEQPADDGACFPSSPKRRCSIAAASSADACSTDTSSAPYLEPSSCAATAHPSGIIDVAIEPARVPADGKPAAARTVDPGVPAAIADAFKLREIADGVPPPSWRSIS